MQKIADTCNLSKLIVIMIEKCANLNKISKDINTAWTVLITVMLDLDNISHKYVMALTQGHISKVKVTVHT